jgi:hypothetical protein
VIQGHKPNGYTTFMNAAGQRVEGETRQCCHCQKMWNYAPGSGITRGWCLTCNGFICAEAPCLAQQKQWIEEYLQATSKVRSCIPLEEWNSRRIDRLAHKFPLDPDMAISPSGLIVPKSCSTVD